MDAVKSFNNELSGLYEVKPPISKAKMTSITRGAIKAIKFYKHVVQSVEKFILKCKPEYKVPGLYVIDSIVRQSRHQFGADRDVFAPRFAKNMQQTFINLFKCPAEDKSKVIRVLNLWQKNQVFPPEVIQPLFDLADPNHPIYREQLASGQSNGLGNSSAVVKGSPALQKSPTKGPQVAHQTDAHVSGVANNPNALHADPNTLAQLQQLHKLLQRQAGDSSTKTEGQPVRFDRKLLDFDYDDDEDEDHVNPSPKAPPATNNSTSAIETVGSLLSNPEVLRQLQTLQQTMSQAQQHQELDVEKLRKLQEMKQQEEEFDKHLAQTVPNLPFASECDLKPPPSNNSPAVLQNYYLTGMQDMSIPPPGYKQSYEMPSQQEEVTLDSEIQFLGANDSADLEVINLDHTDSVSQSPHNDRYSSRRRRSRSRDRSRDRGRDRDRDRRSRRSRSRTRSRDRRRRSRSRDRDRERDRERELEKEKDREKEKERRKRGLPPIKKENLSVCSTTLWVGHLSKLVHQEELSDTFGEFGDVVSIDLIPPRGCAFIVMHRRQDAARCLQKLKNHKMQGKAITIAWAPGKGVKGKDLKDYWEVDLGVSYIPWLKIKPDIDLEMLEDGGMIDEDTMPAWLKNKVSQDTSKLLMPQPTLIPCEMVDGTVTSSAAVVPSPGTAIDTSQPPPLPGGGLLQPPGLPLPIVSPFQLNNRLLGAAVGVNLPPGIMPNVPIGVPPPNMSHGAAMMANQLLGISSPFAQGPPGLLPPPLSLAPDKVPTSGSENISSAADSMLGLPFTMIPQPPISLPPPHEDNMDVEMEDAAERMDKQPPLSDQLLAALGQHNEANLSAAVSRLHAISGQRLTEGPDADEHRDRRDDRGNRGRDRDRNKDRERRDRSGRRNSRDRNRDRDRDRDGRDRRDDRRERGNRWGDRDRKDIERNERDDRRDRSEKSLNDRLREMAHQSVVFPNRDRRQSGDNQDMFDNPPECPPPLPLMERPLFPPPFNTEDPPVVRREPDLLDHHEQMERDERFRPDDFDIHRRRGPENWMEAPEFNHPVFEAPPRPLLERDESGPRPFFGRDDGPPPRPLFGRDDNGPHPMLGRDDGIAHPLHLEREEIFMEEERFLRMEHMEEFMEEPMGMHGEFESPMRGPAFGPGIGPGPVMGPRPGPGAGPRPDFWVPPRGMRGHGIDGFYPRGRLPGPHKFHPRGGGPHMRGGPRMPGPPWKEGMRPNFQPRFEGPPDFFRGPPGPPGVHGPPGLLGPPGPHGHPGGPGHYDEPHHPRHRRRDDRRHFRPDFGGGENMEPSHVRDRRTRWGNSPRTEDTFPEQTDTAPGEETNQQETNDEGDSSAENVNTSLQQPVEPDSSTPLHDEPQEPVIETSEPEPVAPQIESEAPKEGEE